MATTFCYLNYKTQVLEVSIKLKTDAGNLYLINWMEMISFQQLSFLPEDLKLQFPRILDQVN